MKKISVLFLLTGCWSFFYAQGLSGTKTIGPKETNSLF